VGGPTAPQPSLNTSARKRLTNNTCTPFVSAWLPSEVEGDSWGGRGAETFPDDKNDQGTGRGGWSVASVRQRLAPMHLQTSRAVAIWGVRWRVKAALQPPGFARKLALCLIEICNGDGLSRILFTPVSCRSGKTIATTNDRFDYGIPPGVVQALVKDNCCRR
jgi:hypothetical protein